MVIHTLSPSGSSNPFLCARLLLTTGISPRFAVKDDFSHPDRTTERHLFSRPISTKLKDLGRVQMNADRAKYAYFSRFTRKKSWWATFGKINKVGFISFGALIFLSFPYEFVHARAFSYMLTASNTAVLSPLRTEPQNSQTIAFLEAALNIDPKKAMGGGDITVLDDSALISDAGPSGTIADIEASNHQGKVSLYVVHADDTIAGIAKMFGVTVNTILWANDLPRGATLRAGQHLVILPIDGIQHVIQKGDTINSIARKYKGDIPEILEFNDLSVGQKLSVGDVVVVPNGREEVSTPASATPSVSGGRSRTYPAYDGYYTHPVPAGHKTQGIHGYNGVDYGAPRGTPVYSAAEGTVIVSRFTAGGCGRSCFGGYGNYIVIEHPNGTQTLYGHLSSVYTQVGVRVGKGQWIGEVGNTGKSTGSHLHFEVRGAKNPF